MTLYKRESTGEIIPDSAPFTEPRTETSEEIKHPRGWLKRQTSEALGALGLTEYTPPPPEQPSTADLWKDVRAERNAQLNATDWTQLPDAAITETEKTDWRVYRQSLRDITEAPDPSSVVWPTPPEDLSRA